MKEILETFNGVNRKIKNISSRNNSKHRFIKIVKLFFFDSFYFILTHVFLAIMMIRTLNLPFYFKHEKLGRYI